LELSAFEKAVAQYCILSFDSGDYAVVCIYLFVCKMTQTVWTDVG